MRGSIRWNSDWSAPQAAEAKRTGRAPAADANEQLGNRVLSTLIGGLVGGALIGWLLDRWFGTGHVLLISLMVLGTVGGFWSIIKMSTRRPYGGRVNRTRRNDTRGRTIGQDRSDAPVPGRAHCSGATGRLRASRSRSPIRRCGWALTLLVLWAFMLGGMKRELVPGRWQVAVEGFTGFITNMMDANIGPAGRKYVPYVFSLFMFILSPTCSACCRSRWSGCTRSPSPAS